MAYSEIGYSAKFAVCSGQQYSLKVTQQAVLLLLFSCCYADAADDDISAEDD